MPFERRAPRPWPIASGRDGSIEQIPAEQLRKGDLVWVSAGEIIPADGEIIEGPPRWMNRPSRANPRLSSARRVETEAQ